MALASVDQYDFNRERALGLVPFREYGTRPTATNILPNPFPYYVTNMLPSDPLQPVGYGYQGNGHQGTGFYGNQKTGHDIRDDFLCGLKGNTTGSSGRFGNVGNGVKRVTFRDDGLHTSRDPVTSSEMDEYIRPELTHGAHDADETAGRYNVQPHHMTKAFKIDPRDVPIQQFYDLTQLKKSNVRSNDELIPRPGEIAVQDFMINKQFPAENPYSSHISRCAVFPKFAESPEDPKRGVDARNHLPKDPEMPANPYDVIVVSKTKGHPYRRELIHIVPESMKKPLYFPGQNGFDQKVKVHGESQQYFPFPQKTLVPNLETRPPSMQVVPKTANSLRNLEREQWKTSYNLSHTGLGPSNPLALDNYQEKVEKLNRTGELDENLYPRSLPTFDPPRPVEGRIARKLVPTPSPQVVREDQENMTPRRKTPREIEEYRLLNGRDYVNLPERKDTKEVHWKEETDPRSRSDEVKVTEEDEVKVAEKRKSYFEELKEAQKEMVQQMEAENRWRLLESGKPSHDLEALNNKYKISTDKEKPKVFYDHEGKYNEERAGLYQTSYLPERLANSMTQLETSGPEIMNTMTSHVDAINYPTKLNAQMDAALAHSQYLDSSRTGLYISGRMSPTEVLEPHYMQQAEQRRHLIQSPRTARVNVVEKDLINKESEQGSHYNHVKYLQEESIHPEARQEPLSVISHQNQSLGNVRPYATPRRSKSVQFADNVTVATGAGVDPIQISSAPMEGVGNPGVGVSDTQYTSREAQYDWRNSSLVQPRGDLGAEYMNGSKDNAFRFSSRESPRKAVSFARSKRGTYDADQDQFASDSTTLFPGKIMDGSDTFRTAYQSQFKFNIDYKDDARFQWEADSGTPRPQTSLLRIQDRFTKTDAHRKLHLNFRETNPDLRENITDGRQHSFRGYNAQQLRGHTA